MSAGARATGARATIEEPQQESVRYHYQQESVCYHYQQENTKRPRTELSKLNASCEGTELRAKGLFPLTIEDIAKLKPLTKDCAGVSWETLRGPKSAAIKAIEIHTGC